MVTCSLQACIEPIDAEPRTAAAYRADAKRAYEEAVEAYLDHNWPYAEQLFEDIRRDYADSRYARLAELRLADAAFRQEKYAEAIGGYRSFTHDYPNDAEVPYARYRITRAQFLQSDSSFITPPLEERDLSNIKEANVSIRAFLDDFPGYSRTPELQYMLRVVRGLLARHELYVARYYLNIDQFDAAVSRIQFALRTYPESGLEAEGIVLLGETYLKLHSNKKARAAFQHVLQRYPDSPFVIPARNFLSYLGEHPSAEARVTAPEGNP